MAAARAGFCLPRSSAAWSSSASVAAIAFGGGGDDPIEPVATTTATPAATQQATVPASANGIGLSVPAGWSDGATAEIPGFDANAVTMGGDKGGTIVFGYADETAANPTLLADGLRGDTTPSKEIVDLSGGLQAAKYTDLPIGSQTGQVFAIPTTEGVATLACIAEGKTCDAIASSLKITDGKAFPVGPSESYQTRVEKILGRLDKSEKSAARDLKNAGKRTTQVDATSRLGSAYAAAATSLGKLDVSPADAATKAELAASFKTVGNAFKKAASEGRAKDRAGFAKQGKAAVAGGKDIDAGLAGLADAGYELPSSVVERAGSVPKLPTLKRDPKKAAKKSTSTSQRSGGRRSAYGHQPSATPVPQATTPCPSPETRHSAERRRRRPVRRRRGLIDSGRRWPCGHRRRRGDEGALRRRRGPDALDHDGPPVVPRRSTRRGTQRRALEAYVRSLRASSSRSW